ncbi:NADH dehydrogenase [Geosmithia morbida]|uniref:NADH dehydrogenase n=1 Tax=Geosmithia morbida TaxID=1094350 RepID=A0A9P4YY72_9HYPO|nr:NADH dehydrogenase [Geosmithia morbida]KAF4124225.1 NADH dehydrogenase [Geosmithia morbida]
MSPLTTIGPVTRAWYRWKALRLPWRRQFLVGIDLQGNTFWEFRLAGTSSSDRLRRIVRYPRSTHYSEVRITPQWHQWLRYTREDPPSVAEQRTDVARQERIRELAAQADARWEAKPRLAGHDETTRQELQQQQKQQQRAVLGGDKTTTTTTTEIPDISNTATATDLDANPNTDSAPGETMKKKKSKRKGVQANPDPWAKAKASGPSETWQPQAWSPTPRKK